MHPIRVPSLAENVNEATLGTWLVDIGDRVDADQAVAELITEKAEFSLEADVSGTISALLASEKSVIPVGYILCVLDATDEEIKSAESENQTLMLGHFTANTIRIDRDTETRDDTPSDSGSTRIYKARATPAARRLASDHGVDLNQVAISLGTDRILSEDDVRGYMKTGGR